MDLKETIEAGRDTLTVRRVYGEPYERDGVTVIPAASVLGGVGGGSGDQPDGTASGGGGFGVHARPVGAYVIHGELVFWEPAFDLNRVILGGQVVALVGLLVLRSIKGSRRR